MNSKSWFRNCLLLLPLLLLLAQQLPAQLPIERVAGMHYQVHDLSGVRSYYTGMLGLPEAFDFKNAQGETTAAFFKINDDQYLEFSLAAGGPEYLLMAASFLTHDLKVLKKGLQDAGLSPTKPAIGPDGSLHMQLKDPMGNTLDFVQYREGSQQAAHRGADTAAEKSSNHLLHIGLAEDDEVAALAFYKRLGFSQVSRGGPPPNHIGWINVSLPVPAPDYIELMVNPSQPIAGRGHISFGVPDIHQAYDFLVSHHVPGQYKDPTRGRIINLRDPNGLRVEIMAERPTAPPAR
jgi:catechol 2,3-dioxygenase-like lactoylglutathione lyase family enzyme